MGWQFTLALDASADQPLYLQVSRALTAEIRRGRLQAGDRLPGSRTLAQALGVHRNTVLSAYAELQAEGWIESSQAVGTRVSRDLPDVSPRRFSPRAPSAQAVSRQAGFPLPSRPAAAVPAIPPAGALMLTGGLPDLRLVPLAALARAYRRALRLHGRTVLAYGDARGHPRLRAALASMLSESRGVAARRDDLVITRGSQMALGLVAGALLDPGDRVVVEGLGYQPAWAALRAAGAELVPVPVDADGLRIDQLERVVTLGRVRAVYVTTHHQYPTTVSLAPARRMALLALAARRRIAILEDDYDHEFHYEGRPLLPLASADTAGCVVYLGTLAKILAPGLRLGYVVAPRPVLERIAAQRAILDRQGDLAVECAVAELLEDGEVQRHVRRARRIYLARRDAAVHTLRQELGGVLAFAPPDGGMAIWASVVADIDPDRWYEACFERGVVFHPGSRFRFDAGPQGSVRLGFAAVDEREMVQAARRMAQALPSARALPGGRRRAAAAPR